jgi:cytochrome c oxidase subunit I
VSMLIFAWNILASWRSPRAHPVDPGPDPWDARSLEWMVQSPVPAHNFDTPPTVSHLDEFWHRKYQENDEGKVVRVATGAEVAQPGDGTGVHLPSPSYWPLVLAVGLATIGYGLIFNLGLSAVGGLIVVIAGFGLGYEPADDPEAHHGPGAHGDGHGDGDHGAEAELPDHGDGEEPAGDGEPEPVGVTASGGSGSEPSSSASDEKASSDD